MAQRMADSGYWCWAILPLPPSCKPQNSASLGMRPWAASSYRRHLTVPGFEPGTTPKSSTAPKVAMWKAGVVYRWAHGHTDSHGIEELRSR